MRPFPSSSSRLAVRVLSKLVLATWMPFPLKVTVLRSRSAEYSSTFLNGKTLYVKRILSVAEGSLSSRA